MPIHMPSLYVFCFMVKFSVIAGSQRYLCRVQKTEKQAQDHIYSTYNNLSHILCDAEGSSHPHV